MGLFNRKKKPTLEELIENAKSGDVRAIVAVGNMYCDNEEWENAVPWYEKGVKMGDAEAQLGLGQLYELGWGVGKDMKKALKLIRMSADQGYAPAIEELDLIAANEEEEKMGIF